ncbi:hypothetical protein A5880_002299 [Enterococcus sp. 4G2_DIV0659]|uniref:Uncharacterized protein n=1 Tax=Candidatus Enterococcus mansonii TaxID=1834181 RepID=A0A242CIB6_9ENTE|nr:hypothetical protein A5880_000201 [Enterococcus sp. 4G2_DIV0659]
MEIVIDRQSVSMGDDVISHKSIYNYIYKAL